MTAKGKAVYFLKRSEAKLTKANINAELLFGELSVEPLEYLEKLLGEVYKPLLEHPANRMGWGEVAARSMNERMLKLSADVSIVLGQTRGAFARG